MSDSAPGVVLLDEAYDPMYGNWDAWYANMTQAGKREDQQLLFEHVAILLYSLLATVQVYLSCLALSRFRGLTPEKQQKLRPYTFFLIFMTISSLIRFGLYLREASPHVLDIPGLVYAPPSLLYDPNKDSPMEYAISFACTSLLSLIGDAFLAWRATIVWSHNRIVKRVPAAVFVLSFGVCLSSSVFKVLAYHNLKSMGSWAGEWKKGGAIKRVQLAYKIWRMTDFSMSVMVNVVTTTLIITRLLMMERKMRNLAKESTMFRSGLPYRRVIALLLESALPFTLVGIAGVVCAGLLDPINNTYSRAIHAFPILMVAWTNALALGPQCIVLRVISGTTFASSTESPSVQISHHLIFADDPVVSLLASNAADPEYELEHPHVGEPTNPPSLPA
ncbi:hypothetical protein BKA70DRAFT_1491398 [Coprinopsis sp. MPI-PUGE-AT-0042]|nr:hypothetical protein BKA70DRAFT_1491398 [Coprinopsis sp. MPI-PUGE-AT-0042]